MYSNALINVFYNIPSSMYCTIYVAVLIAYTNIQTLCTQYDTSRHASIILYA